MERRLDQDLIKDLHRKLRWWKNSSLSFVVLIVASTLSCGNADEEKMEQLYDLFSDSFGPGSDYVLKQESAFRYGKFDDIAIFFGGADDYKNCQDTANAFRRMSKNGKRFNCSPLN